MVRTGATREQRTVGDKRSPRERLLAAANELFYAEGVQSVGIDRVIDYAGVAKASLYNTFGSKEKLVDAYLASRRALTSERIGRAIDKHDTPRAKLLAIFDSQAEQIRRADYRGCAFAAASVEAPPGGLVDKATRDYRSWLRGVFEDLAARSGARDPAILASQLQLLYDGVASSARMDHDVSAAQGARAAAELLIDSAGAGS